MQEAVRLPGVGGLEVVIGEFPPGDLVADDRGPDLGVMARDLKVGLALLELPLLRAPFISGERRGQRRPGVEGAGDLRQRARQPLERLAEVGAAQVAPIVVGEPSLSSGSSRITLTVMSMAAAMNWVPMPMPLRTSCTFSPAFIFSRVA